MTEAHEIKIPSEVGLAQGAKGPSVEELQAYLARFGYGIVGALDQSTLAQGAAPLQEFTPGTFDQATSEAVLSFQNYYGLPKTGLLDEATIATMAAPRCGNPDNPNSDPAGVSSFTAQGNRWEKTNLRYGFRNFSPELSQEETQEAIAAAFGLWSEVSTLTFQEVSVDDNPEIIVSFVTGDHGDGNPFDGVGRVLAHAYFPPPNSGELAGDTHFDEAETWSVALPVPAGRVDLMTVAAHEFGHALGLAHTDVKGALMFPTYDGAHRFLAEDDIAGIQSLYGGGRGGWESLGGTLTSSPDAASQAPGQLDVFVRATDNTLMRTSYEDGGWSDWESFDGFLASNPSAVSWSNGRLDIFARGTNSGLIHKYYDGGWSSWEDLGGLLTSGPDACSWSPGRLDVFARGASDALIHKYYAGGWSNWETLGGVLTSDPSAVSWSSGRIDVFARGTDNSMWHKWYNGVWRP